MTQYAGRNVTTWDRNADVRGWRQGCITLVLMFLAGLVIGIIIGRQSAAPGTTPATAPQPSPAVSSDRQTPTGTALTSTVNVAARVPVSASPVSSPAQLHHGRTGVIAYADESMGADYLAIPIGPGHLVKVCGPAACWTTVSTDAGPNHERLVAGRIADVAVRQWERICGLSRTAGTCRGSWTVVAAAATLPPTDR